MVMYLKKRYKSYISVTFGVLIGFLISNFLFDTPDYATATIAVLLGLTIGEIFTFIKWKKEQSQNNE